MRTWLAIVTLLIGLLPLVSACGRLPGSGSLDTFIGAPCRDDFDCEDVCARGGSFPGGMCTLRCRDDFDCPDGTGCVDREGGVCAVVCRDDLDCDGFGREYECKDTEREGERGDLPICRN